MRSRRSLCTLLLLNLSFLNSDDAFKTLLHTAPPGKRDYYNSIRQAIQKYRRNKECSRFWLFSLRDGALFSSFLPFSTPFLPLRLLTGSLHRPLGAHVVVRPEPQVGVLRLFVLLSLPSTFGPPGSLLFINFSPRSVLRTPLSRSHCCSRTSFASSQFYSFSPFSRRLPTNQLAREQRRRENEIRLRSCSKRNQKGEKGLYNGNEVESKKGEREKERRGYKQLLRWAKETQVRMGGGLVRRL